MRVWLLVLLLLTGPLWARPAGSSQAIFDRWLAADGLKAAHVGFLLIRLSDGAVLASHDPDRLFVPASTAKIITARAVLESGPLAPMRTRAWQRSDELVLWGGGDPELSASQLRQLAAELWRKGLRQVTRLAVGSPFFAAQAPLGSGWAWDDATEDYSAVISGLTCDRGVARLSIHPAGPGEAPRVEGLPVEVSACTVSGAGSGWNLSRVPGRVGTLLWGEVPAEKVLQTDLAVADPELFAGQILAQALRERGVEVGEVTSLAERERQELRVPEPPLAQVESRSPEVILREALARSDNLAMELLIRVATGRPAPPSPPTARLVDGSGLSRYNLLSPRHLVEALAGNSQLRNLMPLAGVEGTLARRFQAGLAYRQVRAKTGTVSTVSGLAGTIFPDEPERACVFALLTNGYTRPGRELKNLEDSLLEELVRQLKYSYL